MMLVVAFLLAGVLFISL